MAKFQLQIENPVFPEPEQPTGNVNTTTTEVADPTLLSRQRAVGVRSFLYGGIPDQLDMLWHDINEGRIQANTTSDDSWFHHVKIIKDSIPIPEISSTANSTPS